MEFVQAQSKARVAAAAAAVAGATAVAGLPGALVAAALVAVLAARGQLRAARPVLLGAPGVKFEVPLLEREHVSHDVRRLRFGLPTPDHALGLPLGRHVNVIADIDGETVIRSYTPVTSEDDRGFFDLVIKVYFKDVNPRFPNGGKMSQYLNSLPIGGTVAIRGPTGHVTYHGRGRFSLADPRNKNAPPDCRTARRIGMIAGGTGITPMLQVSFFFFFFFFLGGGGGVGGGGVGGGGEGERGDKERERERERERPRKRRGKGKGKEKKLNKGTTLIVTGNKRATAPSLVHHHHPLPSLPFVCLSFFFSSFFSFLLRS